MTKLKKSLKIKIGADKKGKRFIIRDDETEVKEIIQCEVVGYDSVYEEYFILIPEDVRGYFISNFHILNYEVDKKHRGKKFNNVSSGKLR